MNEATRLLLSYYFISLFFDCVCVHSHVHVFLFLLTDFGVVYSTVWYHHKKEVYIFFIVVYNHASGLLRCIRMSLRTADLFCHRSCCVTSHMVHTFVSLPLSEYVSVYTANKIVWRTHTAIIASVCVLYAYHAAHLVCMYSVIFLTRIQDIKYHSTALPHVSAHTIV